ncbi:ScyD/ScyE family protein [Arthrobacter agilis]|uniref:ScyD/ScyE family protein n=1 Tax=Arthrobacter agilis TaxID=37921 RepID=UPI002788EEDE|nr:ScyD/ScyE family protein [Arthrobacter agilis]MDQ0733834.1 hypothetical protein [Arthrobacter agilis]
MKGTRTSFVAAALAVALISTAGPATAGGSAPTSGSGDRTVSAGDSTDLATGLLSPLRLAVGRDDTTYVAQNFAGQLTRVDGDGGTTTIVDRPGIEVGGVSTRHGDVYYTESAGGPGSPDPFVATVSVLEDGDGDARVLADFAALETENNYDGDNEYGFQDLPEECTAQLPADLAQFLLPHGGEVYSHPYATAVSGSGRYVYVADAGANVVWTVDVWDDEVDATVLDPVPTLATAELRASLAADGINLPECVLGYTFNSEPVPTDIEFGPDGLLYLTSLPGVPEDPTLGSVRSFDPESGDIDVVVTGLTSPTGLAFDRDGNLFVAELFANRISIIPAGTDDAEVFTDATLPADVEVDGKYLYSTRNAVPGDTAPAGTLVRTRLEYDRH